MIQPIISIVIPCFNHGQYIEQTIASVINNTKKYFSEIIVVNDGSTDSVTLEVLKHIEKSGIHVLNQKNQGLGAARNNGIKIAKGKYILPLDSDNNVTFHYLNTAIEILEKNPAISIIYGDAQYFGEKKGIWKNELLNKRRILYTNQIDACAVYRKTTWEKVNGYATDMPFMGSEDWNFWLRCINAKETFFYLNEICFEYRVLGNSMIRTVSKDSNAAIFGYNTSTLYNLYNQSMRDNDEKLNTIFYGGLIRKITKMILHHFGKYSYLKSKSN